MVSLGSLSHCAGPCRRRVRIIGHQARRSTLDRRSPLRATLGRGRPCRGHRWVRRAYGSSVCRGRRGRWSGDRSHRASGISRSRSSERIRHGGNRGQNTSRARGSAARRFGRVDHDAREHRNADGAHGCVEFRLRGPFQLSKAQAARCRWASVDPDRDGFGGIPGDGSIARLLSAIGG